MDSDISYSGYFLTITPVFATVCLGMPLVFTKYGSVKVTPESTGKKVSNALITNHLDYYK